MSGYSDAGASYSRRAMKGFTSKSISAQDDIDGNNGTLRQRARMLYMSSPVATSAINTNRTKVVGTGLSLQSSIDSALLGMNPDKALDWKKRTESEFALWAEKKQNCDALGMNNFAALQQLALKSWLLSGDVFALVKRADPTPANPYTLRLHLIEADRVSTPHAWTSMGATHVYKSTEGTVPKGKPGAGNKVYDGVEVDGSGQVVAYYICSGYPNGRNRQDLKWTRVKAYGSKTGLPNILHIMDAERPDQYRGVPYLAQVIEPLLQLRRYTESELMAALVQSFFTAWIVTETDQTMIPINEVGQGSIAGLPSENPGDGVSDDANEYEMGPGSVTHLKAGEKIEFGNPNIPTAGFETFVKTMCRMVGSGLELPYDVLIKEYNSSYSASRGALLEAWAAFKMRRAWFVDDFCQPVYELWLAEAVARGRIKAPGFFDDPLVRNAWSGASWIGPVQESLDPLKEAKAAVLMINQGIKTRTEVTMEQTGGDWNSNMEQLALENAALKEAGIDPASTSVTITTGDGDGEGD